MLLLLLLLLLLSSSLSLSLLLSIIFLHSGDIVMPNKGRRVSMRIVHRHHFSSALKRMSAIVSLQNPGSSSSEYIVTVKGAPETLRPMVRVGMTVVI